MVSDAVLVAAIAAGASTLGAVLSLRNGRKADAIHVLVNSNLTEVKKELADAKMEIKALHSLIAGQMKS